MGFLFSLLFTKWLTVRLMILHSSFSSVTRLPPFSADLSFVNNASHCYTSVRDAYVDVPCCFTWEEDFLKMAKEEKKSVWSTVKAKVAKLGNARDVIRSSTYLGFNELQEASSSSWSHRLWALQPLWVWRLCINSKRLRSSQPHFFYNLLTSLMKF